MDYDAVRAQAMALLQQEQRLSYRVLKRQLQLDCRGQLDVGLLLLAHLGIQGA